MKRVWKVSLFLLLVQTRSYLGNMPDKVDEKMSTIRVSGDMLRSFNGDGDVVAWLQKVKLVAKLGGVTDLASFLPLYLEGSALAVYLEMDERLQSDAGSIEKRLKEVYSDSDFVAYAKVVGLKWSGESVDVYANEIRRLAGLAGFTGEGLTCMMRLAFVTGFPDSISAELQQCGTNAQLSYLISRARILCANRSSTSQVGAVAKATVSGVSKDFKSKSGGDKSGFRGKCFRCEGPHMARDCPDKKPVKCYACQEEGHLSYNCPRSNSLGN